MTATRISRQVGFLYYLSHDLVLTLSSWPELRATFHDFTQVIDEWRAELVDCASFKSDGATCSTCGNTESAKRQLQEVQLSVNKQLERLNQLQDIASSLERDILRVLDKSKQHVDRMIPRAMLVERAILCVSELSQLFNHLRKLADIRIQDTNAQRAITQNCAMNAAILYILEAAICSYVPDLSAAKDDETVRNLKSLFSHLECDGSDVEGFLRDCYFLEDAEVRATGFSHGKMAERLRARIQTDLSRYQQAATTQRELVSAKSNLITLLESTLAKEQNCAGKGTITSSVSRLFFLDYGRVETSSWQSLKQEIMDTEDHIRTAKLELLELRAKFTRLQTLVLKLERGWEFARDDKLFKLLIVDYSGPLFPREHSKEFADNMLKYAAQTSNKTLAKMIDILFGKEANFSLH